MRNLVLVILAVMVLLILPMAAGCGGLPQVSFNASVSSGRAPLNVSFTNTTPNVDADSKIVFDWDFGDGTTQKAAIVTNSVSHSYATAGTFTVTLTEYNSDTPSKTSTATKTITVTPATAN
jgi:PKD repeat protein